MSSYPKNSDVRNLLLPCFQTLGFGASLALLLGIIGVLVSVNFDNWHWFSRSGSLIVICGLFIAKWDFENLIKENDLGILESSITHHIEKMFPGTEPKKEDVETIKEALHIKLVGFVKPIYVKGEIFIVSLGTVIWGFGDLVPTIINI